MAAARRREAGLLPDTHAHLESAEFEADRDTVIRRAREAGVNRILAVGSDLLSSRKAVEIAHAHAEVYAAVGVHPHDADRFDEEAPALRALLREEKVVALGEIGLDYFRDRVPREVQLRAFQVQMEWAALENLPASVHNRSADADILRVTQDAGTTTVLHCFSGERGLAEAALSLGCYLSFAGNVTYPKASGLREAAQVVPLGRLLVETDSPVLAPQSRRGKRNEPACVVAVAEELASVRRETKTTLSDALSANACTVFAWGCQ